MFAAYTELRNAEKVRGFLVKNDLFNKDFLIVKEHGYIFFPLSKKTKIPFAQVVEPKFKFPRSEKSVTVESNLQGQLTSRELSLLPQTQEIVGKIMILEIPPELEKKELLLAQAYLQTNKQIETVVKKQAMHSGVFRTRKLKVLAGKKSKETIHYENGIKLKLHLEKTYFSSRSGNERLRIAKQVKENENVLVMFSGAAPYPLVIAKNSPVKMVYGIELNPLAHQYALANVSLNKLERNIRIFHGDVLNLMPKIRTKFERIVMPLPKTGENYLGLALKKVKKNTLIHFYSFLNETEISSEAKRIKKLCASFNSPVKVVRKVKCGRFSPGVFRVCFDLRVL